MDLDPCLHAPINLQLHSPIAMLQDIAIITDLHLALKLGILDYYSTLLTLRKCILHLFVISSHLLVCGLL